MNQRVAPSSLEGRACLFDFDATTGELTAWISSQTIYQAQRALARSLLAYTTPISPNTTARMLNGPYQIQALDFQAVGVFTNTVPMLEAAPADLEMTGGQVRVRGAPGRTMSLGELARQVEEQPDLIEHDPPNPVNGTPIEGLAAWREFSPSGPTFSSGAHVAVVEVETETGEVRVLSYVAVDDCGRVLNSYLTEAQVHGGIAQGIGQALYEEAAYDQNGQPLARRSVLPPVEKWENDWLPN